MRSIAMIIIRMEFNLFLLILMLNNNYAEETVCSVNGKKPLHIVSDKFLSFTVDPVILLSGLNISDSSMRLARFLSPAYVKVSGPSTAYLKLSANEVERSDHIHESNTVLRFTPSMLNSLNNWFITTNLTPILALNDKVRIDDNWNPRSAFPLLELSDQMEITCMWQLGHDTSGKSFDQYKADINSLNHMVQAFPKSSKTWKIVGGDLSSWFELDHVDKVKEAIDVMKNTTFAVMWDKFNEEWLPNNDAMSKLLATSIKSNLPIWTTAPKMNHAISFSYGLMWAKEIGEVARMGYDVLFRQPRLYEYFADTPIYWITLLHKTLMGCNVLDVNVNPKQNCDTFIYSHCTKKQNSFSRRGAMTIFIVNNGTYEHTTVLKFNGISPMKNLEVQSYILTSDSEESTDTYLNGQILSMDMLDENNIFFIPKLRRARNPKHLTLSVPPKSVGFFVLPDARVPVCINDESEAMLLMEEIHNDQNTEFSGEQSYELMPRIGENEPATNLNELYQMMEAELEADEKYYRKMTSKNGGKDWKQMLVEKFRETKVKGKNLTKVDEAATIFLNNKNVDSRKLYMAKKKNEINKKKDEFMQKLSEKTKLFKDKTYGVKEEIEAKNYSTNIEITSEELEQIIIKATEILNDEVITSKFHKRAKRGVDKYISTIPKSTRNFAKMQGDINETHKKYAKRAARVGHRGGGHHKSNPRNRQRTTSKPKTTKVKEGVKKVHKRENMTPSQTIAKLKRHINMEMLRLKTEDNEKISKTKPFHKVTTNPKRSKENFDSEEDFMSELPDSPEAHKITKSRNRENLDDDSTEDAKKSMKRPSLFNRKKYQHGILHLADLKKPLQPVLHNKRIDGELKIHQPNLDSTIFSHVENKGRYANVDYVDEDKNDREFDDVDDDVSIYHGFDGHFGGNVKIVKPIKRIEKELCEVDGFDRNMNNIDLLLDKEFVINQNDKSVVKQTINDLENYFNRAQDSKHETYDSNLSVEDDYDDVDYPDVTKDSTRYKREERQYYTEDDIRQYKQLMNTNIRHMKENIRKQKMKHILKKDPPILAQKISTQKNVDMAPKPILPPNLTQTEKAEADIVSSSHNTGFRPLRKPAAAPILNYEDIKLGNNIKFLKSRLAQQKLKQNLQDGRFHSDKSITKQMVEVDDETKELIRRIKHELRNRKHRSVDESFDKEYIPTAESVGNVRERYESIFENKLDWRKEDILKLKKADIINKNVVLNRQERYIDEDVERNTNDIESLFNAIKKDASYVIPALDDQRSEFSLVLPTQDEISFTRINGDTEIKFKHHVVSETPPDEGTCPINTSTLQINADLDTSTSNIVENSINSTDYITEKAEREFPDATITLEVYTLNDSDSFEVDWPDVVEAPRTTVSRKGIESNLVDKIFNAIAIFMNDMQEKLNKCVAYLHG